MTAKIRLSPVHAKADVAVVGGGLGGSILAAALGSEGVSVVCLERNAAPDTAKDYRTTAIARGPKRFLQECGIWGLLEAKAACPIRRIRVEDRGLPPALEFLSDDTSDEPFGWIVDNSALRDAIGRRLKGLRGVKTEFSAEVDDIETSSGAARAVLKDGRVIEASLIVAADGRNSRCRDLAGIKSYGWDYGQTAIVCAVSHSKPHENTAVESFHPHGPLATLPLFGNRSSIVWCEDSATAKKLMGMDPQAFGSELQERAGRWLGRVKLEGKRQAWPLNLRRARKYTACRMALVSEAAHGIHPIAGQGLNLGMRDMKSLAREVAAAKALGLDAGSDEVLRRYERSRKFDNGTMVLGMDALVRLFSSEIPMLGIARRAGLGAVAALPPLKRFFANVASEGWRD